MSLFGDDYDGPPSRGSGGGTGKSSLFDSPDPVPNGNGTTPAAAKQTATTTSMFGDPSADDDDGSSPWASFTPRKNTRRSGAEVVRSLLSDAEVPEAYVDAWEALSAGKGGVEEAEVRRALLSGGVGAEQGERIWSIVSANGEARVLGRGQFWVLLALLGLAGEGEELGLDAVDERRARLPVPTEVEGLVKKVQRPVTPPPQQEQAPPQQQEQQQGAQRSPARERGGAGAARKPSFGFGESDPWASPEMHKGHAHSNGIGATGPAPTMRTTSEFSTTAAAAGGRAGNGSAGGFNAQPSATSEAGSSWGASNAYTAGGGFGTTPESGGGFGDDSGPNQTRRSTAPRPVIPKGVEEVITIAMLEEKEGMFLFQHRNYEVGSVRRNSKVIRRYSDFVWLLDCLHKRYPFRQLPLLPPKRMAINGNHIAADGLFIEKRRRGLARFANALVRHPILREEQLVVMFLTVPTVEARPPTHPNLKTHSY